MQFGKKSNFINCLSSSLSSCKVLVALFKPHLEYCFRLAGNLGNNVRLLPEKHTPDGAWVTLGRDCGCFRLCELEDLLDRE